MIIDWIHQGGSKDDFTSIVRHMEVFFKILSLLTKKIRKEGRIRLVEFFRPNGYCASRIW